MIDINKLVEAGLSRPALIDSSVDGGSEDPPLLID